MIADVLKRRIRQQKHSVSTIHDSIFSDPDVVKELSRLHENVVIVPQTKNQASMYICLQETLCQHHDRGTRNKLPGNPTYNLIDVSASEVLDNHKSVLISFGIQTSDDELDFHTYIGFERCTKIHINTDSLPVPVQVFYSFFSQTCSRILSKVFRSTAK